MSLLAAFLGDSLHLETFQVQRALSVLCQMKPHRRQEARDPWTVKAQGSSCPHAHWQGGAGRPGRQDTVGTQAAIWSETAGSSQKNSASSFPTVLWEPPGIKPPQSQPSHIYWEHIKRRPQGSSPRGGLGKWRASLQVWGSDSCRVSKNKRNRGGGGELLPMASSRTAPSLLPAPGRARKTEVPLRSTHELRFQKGWGGERKPPNCKMLILRGLLMSGSFLLRCWIHDQKRADIYF